MYSKLRERYKTFGTTANDDAVYESTLVTLYVNRILQNGKKTIALRVMWRVVDLLKKNRSQPHRLTPLQQRRRALSLLELAVKNAAPQVVFKSSKARFGRKSKPVPIEIPSYRASKIAIKWIVEAARHRRKAGREKDFPSALVKSILLTGQKRGHAFKQKKQLHLRAKASLKKPRRRKQSRLHTTST